MGQSTPTRSGRPEPSHMVIGMEKVTGTAPHPSAAAARPRQAPASALAAALAFHEWIPTAPSSKVLKFRRPLAWLRHELVWIAPPRPTVPTTSLVKSV